MICGDDGNAELAGGFVRQGTLRIANRHKLAALVALVPWQMRETRPSTGA